MEGFLIFLFFYVIEILFSWNMSQKWFKHNNRAVYIISSIIVFVVLYITLTLPAGLSTIISVPFIVIFLILLFLTVIVASIHLLLLFVSNKILAYVK